jgi:hypothetical protein
VPTTTDPATGLRRWGALIVVGLLGGLLSGAFGVGGGIVMVPLLIYLAKMDQRRASATSLAAILPTSIAGAIGYLARGEANLGIALFVAVGGVVGSWIGTWLLRRLPIPVLRWLFVGLLLVVAARMLTTATVTGSAIVLDARTALSLIGVGLIMGLAAGLFGIGGGLVVVPALVLLLGMGDLLAKGTSLLVMAPTSAAGTWSNARAGMVDLRDGLVVGVTATAASFLGVAVAFWLPARPASVMFALLVLATAIQMAVRAIRKR